MDASVKRVFLRHLMVMAQYFIVFPRLTKGILKVSCLQVVRLSYNILIAPVFTKLPWLETAKEPFGIRVKLPRVYNTRRMLHTVKRRIEKL